MSCGIIMFDQNNNVLLSRSKKDKYTFPKGKIELGETNYQCAKREFSEESGISGIIFTCKKNTFEEINERGKIITYFVCKIIEIKENYLHKLNDPDHDILESKFFSIYDAYNLENFSIERKNILKSCLNVDDDFIDEM